MSEIVLRDHVTINYFTDRQHTQKILKDMKRKKKQSKKYVFTVQCAIHAKNFQPTGSSSSKKGSGHFTKTYNTGTSAIQTGAPKALFFKLMPIEAVNFRM